MAAADGDETGELEKSMDGLDVVDPDTPLSSPDPPAALQTLARANPPTTTTGSSGGNSPCA